MKLKGQIVILHLLNYFWIPTGCEFTLKVACAGKDTQSGSTKQTYCSFSDEKRPNLVHLKLNIFIRIVDVILSPEMKAEMEVFIVSKTEGSEEDNDVMLSGCCPVTTLESPMFPTST